MMRKIIFGEVYAFLNFFEKILYIKIKVEIYTTQYMRIFLNLL